jgi:transposase
MLQARDLTDGQWKILDPLIPEPRKRRDGRGRPWKRRRSVMNGILWVLRTVHPGPTFLTDTHHFRRATGAFNSGSALG